METNRSPWDGVPGSLVAGSDPAPWDDSQSDVVDDPGAPRLVRPVPARAVHALMGRRVIHVRGDGAMVTDLRAAGEPAWTDDGSIVVPVIDEHDWYLWATRSNNQRHPSLRAVEFSSLWVEA